MKIIERVCNNILDINKKIFWGYMANPNIMLGCQEAKHCK